MMVRLAASALIISMLAFAGCGSEEKKDSTQTSTKVQTEDLHLLADWMTGSFSSQEQSEEDAAYYDVRLQMVPVWEDRRDGYWLYVEQAIANSLDEPYRQRVYHLTQEQENIFKSEVYTFEEPRRFARAWELEQPLASLAPDSLTWKEDCDIYLTLQGDSLFVGSTREGKCISDFRGADYATSDVRLSENLLYTLDRGWTEDGVQVWGARDEGYYFQKIENYEVTAP
jgi:hypothetical protein